jgi:biotin carboxyl carrier protein
LAAEKFARELKKQKEEEEKLAKKAALELAKAEKEAKLASEKAAKEAKKKPAAAVKEAEPVEDEEPDVVKKIEFEGKKYLKSKKTGVVYDYTEYVKNGEQVVVGKWNDSSNKIDFNKTSDEEEEEEYSM